VLRLGEDVVVLKRGLTELKVAFPGAGDVVDHLVRRTTEGADPEAVVAEFHPDVQPEVARVVAAFRARQLIHDRPVAEPADRFWLSMAPYAPEGRDRLACATVLALGTGAVADALAGALRSSGVAHVVRTGLAGEVSDVEADLWCAAADGPADPALLEVAGRAQRRGAVLVTTWLDELLIRVGPTAHPGDTACLHCYLLRLDANDPRRDLHRALRREADGTDTAGHLPAIAEIAGRLGALEAVKQLSGLPVSTVGHVIELGLTPYCSDLRRVLKAPRCPTCSGVADHGGPVVAHASQLSE